MFEQPCGLRVSASLLAPPKLCVEQAAEESAACDASHAVALQSRLWIGQLIDAETRKQTEGTVERRNIEAGEGAEERVVGEGEVADEPEGAGGELCCNAGDERVDVRLREAIEKEVGGDEIGLRCDIDFERGALQRGETASGVGNGLQAAAAKFVEHDGADIGSDRGALRVAEEKLLEEAAVAIAEDESVARLAELIEETCARALQ